MSSSHENQGKKRAHSPCCCKTSLATLNASEESIQQLEKTLEDEQRRSVTLGRKRNQGQHNAKIWEEDLGIIRGDLCKSQQKFQWLIDRFVDLQFRIREAYPDFPIWNWQNPKPPNN